MHQKIGFNPRSSHTKDSKKWYLMLPCLTLSIIRLMVSNPGKGEKPSLTRQCSSYWKGRIYIYIYIYTLFLSCPWLSFYIYIYIYIYIIWQSRYNDYQGKKWTWRPVFKSWKVLFAFHTALIILGKAWIRLFSLQLWGNSRADWHFNLGMATSLGEGKLFIQTC